jgi:hypothetical protein
MPGRAVVARQRVAEEIVVRGLQESDVMRPGPTRRDCSFGGDAKPDHIAGEGRIGFPRRDTPAHHAAVAIGPDEDIAPEGLAVRCGRPGANVVLPDALNRCVLAKRDVRVCLDGRAETGVDRGPGLDAMSQSILQR